MTEADGSFRWCVNGGLLNYLEYHFKYDIPKFRNWGPGPYPTLNDNWNEKESAIEDAIQADIALSILADYFEEQPTDEQLKLGQCRCWKYHMDFRRDFTWFDEITSDTIADWIKHTDRQYSIEEDIIQRLHKLSMAVSILN